MAQLNTYLTFDGTCAEALKHYEKVIGGKIVSIVTHGQATGPSAGIPGNADRVMNGVFVIDGQTLMASDSFPGQPYAGMNGFNLVLTYKTEDEAKKVFSALGTGGRIVMPPQSTAFAKFFGMLVDKFGTPWTINGAVSNG